MRTVRVFDGTIPSLAGRFGPAQPLPTAFERLVANVSLPDGTHGVDYMFDPDPVFIGAGEFGTGSPGVQDRAATKSDNTYCIWSGSTGQTLVPSTAINGRPTLTLAGATHLSSPDPATRAIRKDELSLFAVVHKTSSGTAEHVFGSGMGGTGNEAAMSALGIGTTGNLNCYLGGSVLADATQSYFDVPVLIAGTLSADRGATIRRNGVQVGAAPGNTAPCTNDAVSLFRMGSTTVRFTGYVADMVVCRFDASRPEYARWLQAFEAYLLDFYGLTLGA